MKLLRVRRHGRWRNVEIATLEDFQSLVGLHQSGAETVFQALANNSRPDLDDAPLDLFEHGDSDLRHDIALAMQRRQPIGKKAKFAPAMIKWLLTHPDPDFRWAAACFLTFSWDRRAARPLMRVVGNQDECVKVRGQAAEVRFWSLFALGKSRSRKGLRAVRSLLSDHTVCPGWWKINEEALDAEGWILGRPTPDRDCVSVGESHCPPS